MDGAWSVLLVLGALACFTAGAAAVLVGQRYALDLLSPADAEETALEAAESTSPTVVRRDGRLLRLDGTLVSVEDAARLRTEFEALLTASEEDEASEEERGALDRDALVTVPASTPLPAPAPEEDAPASMAPAALSTPGDAVGDRVLRCGGSHARHDYAESPFTPRRCNRCGCEEPRLGSGVKSPVTTAEEAAAWQSGSVPASSAGPSRPARPKDEAGKRPRAALRGGSSEPLMASGEPRHAGAAI